MRVSGYGSGGADVTGDRPLNPLRPIRPATPNASPTSPTPPGGHRVPGGPVATRVPGGPVAQGIAGRDIGPYTVDRLLGRGGMGEVHVATDRVLGRQVALKLLNPRHQATALERFFREATIQARIDHPNVVQVYTAGTDAGFNYIAMEYVDGGDLESTLASQGSIPMRSVVEMALQAADGLAAAHDLGILHRDVKPSNMLVDRVGRLKIVDFGIAKIMDKEAARLTAPGSVLGTAGYMSPEQCAGEELDAASDVYALGVLIYRMIVGKTPHAGRTPFELLSNILHSPRKRVDEFRKDVPERLTKIVDRALAISPADRYATARHLEADLRLCSLEMDLEMLMG